MYKVIMKKERESFFRLLDLSVIIHAIGDTTVSTFCIEIRDALGYNNFSSSNINYGNIPGNAVSSLTSNFETITIFTDHELISSNNNKITNEILTQLNLPSTSNNHINKRKIQSLDLIIKKPKVQYNGISSLLKRSGSPLLKEDHKRFDSNLNNIENDNKMITDVSLNYKQVILGKNKKHWIEAINAELGLGLGTIIM
ncbi:hypothetical protein U3516DRAFT_660665 [Neocallimastix sp. 'constans']